MAKNKRRKKPAASSKVLASESTPKFEIGVKGDEFDLKFSRAASQKTGGADTLLRNLSKETGISGYNLLNFAVLTLTVLFFSLSFALLSRSGEFPKLNLSTLLDGSFTSNFGEYYNDTLPFKYTLNSIGARFGFCDMPEIPDVSDSDEIPEEPDNIQTEPTAPPEPPMTTSETEATTAPTSESATSAPISEPEPVTEPETFTMYANATLNIRLSPDSDSMIMGYFELNEKVPVIEILDDGWASIWYNGMVAYVSADLLGETKLVTTKATTTEPQTEETTEETTLPPEPTEDSEVETEPTEESSETVTHSIYMTPEYSAYLARESRLAEEAARTSETEAESSPVTEPSEQT